MANKQKYDWKAIEEKLKEELTSDRYRHTLGVTYTACALAMRYDADMDKARAAGLLHDCAKCIPNDKKIEICSEQHIPVTPFELSHTALLHAKLGPYIARKRYNVTDPDVLDAINWHTTGKPEMTLLEKIIYIADYIEPNRDKAPNLYEVRKLAFRDIDRCMYRILKDSVDYLSEKPDAMDEMTMRAYAYYDRMFSSED
ncbi:MAG: bis(5'-nucleosyl)-tetraphosphatase (symmetrical) YqeK [Eubacterium sp.]|nr:bis(5'-nucleosyl)-tetraphosphatase (symmetrical) YqeK [Eubacterium sp.]